MLMCANDGGIDHQPLEIGLAGKSGQDPVEHAHLDPAIIPPLHRLIATKALRQVAPASAGTGHPQKSV
jgi:hypothetical protein